MAPEFHRGASTHAGVENRTEDPPLEPFELVSGMCRRSRAAILGGHGRGCQGSPSASGMKSGEAMANGLSQVARVEPGSRHFGAQVRRDVVDAPAAVEASED